MGNYKWITNENLETPLLIGFMTSRNKDNKHLGADFKERKVAMIFHLGSQRLNSAWEQFKAEARPGEMCRLYISLNARNPQIIKRKLIHYLIDAEDNFDFTKLNNKVVGFAAEKDSALEHKWFFDFDESDIGLVKQFEDDIQEAGGKVIRLQETPHGFAVVVEKGFDTRKLLEDWKSICGVTLKRDDLICEDWYIKE